MTKVHVCNNRQVASSKLACDNGGNIFVQSLLLFVGIVPSPSEEQTRNLLEYSLNTIVPEASSDVGSRRLLLRSFQKEYLVFPEVWGRPELGPFEPLKDFDVSPEKFALCKRCSLLPFPTVTLVRRVDLSQASSLSSVGIAVGPDFELTVLM